ncbi:MAG: response regulator [Rhodospirillaceae bacterium]|nr:response regulator [Rhodospirillaceae bacterium]
MPVGKSLRVLIVEDEAVIALSLSIGVQNADHELVGVADNAETALEIAERYLPHAALVDVKLKGAIDGMTVGRELAQRYGTAIIFTTAHQDRVLTESRDVAFGVLTKPFTQDQVVAELARALQATQAEPEPTALRYWHAIH